ncbi:MAG: hypothetical protein J0H53_07680 [Rhizobiales bacterium]|nr:hypothetical protein [Hyphomicrobiales bacterium]
MTLQTHPASVDTETLDGAVLTPEQLAPLMEWARGRKLCDYKVSTRFFDFEAYGKPFTQAAILFEPETPLIVDGRKVVVIGSEGGSDNGRGFLKDNKGREGVGPYLARRGITFMTLCRLGRWNFFSDDELGSWDNVPLETRMPIFHRGQKGFWGSDQFVVTDYEAISSHTGSEQCRVAKPGSEFQKHLAALTPVTSMRGFETAMASLVDPTDKGTLLLYYGFSTGGTYLWALANRTPPDGILGYGTASLPVSQYAFRSAAGNYRSVYEQSMFRVRQRGLPDFTYFNTEVPEAERLAMWEEASKAPRFKNHEDTFMHFNIAAQTEALLRLWNDDFMPAEDREKGLVHLLTENLSLMFPGDRLGSVAVFELYGTKDEVLPPKSSRIAEGVMSPYCRKYSQAYLEGYHHSISADHVEAFGALWLRAIYDGYFNKTN